MIYCVASEGQGFESGKPSGRPPRNPEGRTRTKTMKNTKKNGNGKMTIRAELVGSPVEEWTEFRVYMGKNVVASFGTEEKAKSFIERAA